MCCSCSRPRPGGAVTDAGGVGSVDGGGGVVGFDDVEVFGVVGCEGVESPEVSRCGGGGERGLVYGVELTLRRRLLVLAWMIVPGIILVGM
jgi:hypothetical protein